MGAASFADGSRAGAALEVGPRERADEEACSASENAKSLDPLCNKHAHKIVVLPR